MVKYEPSEDPDDDEPEQPASTRKIKRIYTFRPNVFESPFQAENEDDDDSNDKIEITEYQDGTYSAYIYVHHWHDGHEGWNTIMGPERLRTNVGSSNTLRLIGGTVAYKVYVDSLVDNDGLSVKHIKVRSNYDGVLIEAYNSDVQLGEGVYLIINKKVNDSSKDTDDKVEIVEVND